MWPARLLVNGQAASVRAEPGTFAALRRRWQPNDTVEIALPFSFRTVAVDDRNPNTVALMRGPVMLVAVNAPAGFSMSPDALTSLKPIPGKPLEFECETARFIPFYRVQDETYTTYFPLTPDGARN